MNTRQLDIYAPASYSDFIDGVLEKHSGIAIWKETMEGDILHVQMLIAGEESEPVLDDLEAKLSGVEGFRIVIVPVEASIPRPDDKEKQEKKVILKDSRRISREELYSDITNTIDLNWVYIMFIVLATLVAAVGLMKNNVAAIIGAMVIAPLLGANVGLSLATTLADAKLGLRSALTLLVGLAVGLALSIAIGIFVDFDPTISEIASRTQVTFGDIIIALASGSVGVLAFTTALPTMLVGVMVAVALLPPLVVFGLLLGAGQFDIALGAGLLLLSNLICINLAGVITFYLQGVRPLKWWEAEKAKKATSKAVLSWLILFGILIVLIKFSR